MAIGKVNKDKSKPQIAEDSYVKRTKVGDYSVIEKDCVVLNAEIGMYVDIEKRNLIRKAVIGDMSYTGADTSIMWAEIGRYCAISRMVDIGGNQHNYKAATIMPVYRMNNKLGGPLSLHPDEEMIRIGNDVWIGQGVSIVRKEGLEIGDGAVIGSGAVVTKSIPPYAIAAGVPARVIGYRFEEDIIRRLLALKWWDWPAEKVLANRDLLTGDLTEEKLERLEAVQNS